MGNVEPTSDRQVHGMLIEISANDMKKLKNMEHQYDARAVEVDLYDEDVEDKFGDETSVISTTKSQTR